MGVAKLRMLYRSRMHPRVIRRGLTMERIERNLFEFLGCHGWYLLGTRKESRGSRVVVTMNHTKPEPTVIEGVLMDRFTAGNSSKLNASIKVFEADPTRAANPRMYTIPMDNPHIHVRIESQPRQLEVWERCQQEWQQALKSKP
eukprot:NODE_5954_length_621_cov_26.103147_g5552_i0.p1 GENE.NODE_5954_length_621_cov_26.103147_g5552_i0~~NODE_5954_length_621_cov_26.103147_g5552_i0.p1  ORF type:complete len:144 (-),score=22.56 NODE_5954_length_621_cov_26.103147_g5552_i0:68-499(-)